MEGVILKNTLPPLLTPEEFKKVKWTKEDYNKEPVFYCKKCLSLAIIAYNEAGIEQYCNSCGSIDIATTSIEDWQTKYKERYNKEY